VRPEIAILTALDCELAAVLAMLDDRLPVGRSTPGDPNQYTFGTLPSRGSSPHSVVSCVLPRDGNRATAAVTAHLLRTFPSVSCVIFCGIAGGVPGLAADAVRLGDVIVAADGAVDYDHTRTVNGTVQIRRHLREPSGDLHRACLEFRAAHADQAAALEEEIRRVPDPRFARPAATSDRFAVPASVQISRVHWGWVGSADRHVSDAGFRDDLAARHGIKAVEMEAAGLAVAVSDLRVDWFVVRGVSDYADAIDRNYEWHEYAALAAAAFTRLLLSHCNRLGNEQYAGGAEYWGIPQQSRRTDPTRTTQLAHLLMAVPSWLDPSIRRAVVDELPRQIGGIVSQTPTPFLETRDLIRTCLDYSEGPEQLLSALRQIVGPTDSVRAFEAAVRTQSNGTDEWPGR
jgi:nucleoside phosphorylase